MLAYIYNIHYINKEEKLKISTNIAGELMKEGL